MRLLDLVYAVSRSTPMFYKSVRVANAAGQAISATYLASVSTEDIVFKIETEASAKMELSAHRYMKLISPHKVVRFHC